MSSVKTENKVIRDIKKIISTEPDYWDFKENSERSHIHKLIRYPATMVPLMQSKLIELFIEHDEEIQLLLDPFMGSGTTIVEANSKGLNTLGIDINPFAYLITKVKLTPIDLNTLEEKIECLIKKITESEGINYNFWFYKIEKWFKPEIIHELSIIKKSILEERNVNYRRIMWIAFARTIQYSSNDRESTFKLHAKPQKDIEAFEVNVRAYFVKMAREIIGLFREYYDGIFCVDSNTNLYCGDSIKVLKKVVPDESVDIISTSPPYGDNATTVTYGQYSMLQLRWIPVEDIGIEINEDLLMNFSSLDRCSLGGTKYTKEDINKSEILQRSKVLNDIYLKLIARDEKKARKVVSFYIDYERTLVELFRVIKWNKYLVFTVGNRKVDDEIISLDQVTIELCKHLSGKCVYQFERNILNKRMPNKVSKLKNNKPVSSMKKETILIFVKAK